MPGPGEPLGRAAGRDRDGLESRWRGQPLEGGCEVVVEEKAVLPVLDQLRGARLARRRHGKSRGHPLEHRVAEGVVTCRQHEKIGRGVPGLDVVAMAQEMDALGHTELDRQPTRRLLPAAPHHEKLGRRARVRQTTNRPVQTLAVQPSADEERHWTLEPEPAPQPLSVHRTSLGMEARGIHTVVDHDETFARHGVTLRDLLGPTLRDAVDDLGRIGEDRLLDSQDGSMPRRERALESGLPVDALHVLRMAPAPTAIDLLPPCAREAVHQVEAVGRRARRSLREETHAQRLPDSGHANATQMNAGWGVQLDRPAHDRDLVSELCELLRGPQRVELGTAGTPRETLDHDGDSHGAREGSRTRYAMAMGRERRGPSLGWALLLVTSLSACSPLVPEPPPGELRINLGTEPPTLDWTRATDNVSITVIEQLMRGLTQLDPELKPAPALAERWDVSGDGLRYTFHLRTDVRWSDGVPLSAEQFVYSWRRLLDPATAAEYAYFLYPVRGARAFNSGALRDPAALGVRALDAHTLRVELERPLVYFPSLTTFMVTFPLRRDLIERYGDAWTEPGQLVSLGPFRLEEWRHEYRLRLRANESYFAGAPVLRGITAYMVEQASTALVLFEQGLLDIVRLPPLEIRRYRDRPSYRRAPALRGYYYGFNTRLAPFDRASVRRAFAMSIDRSEFPRLLQGGEIPAAYWIPPGMPHHNPDVGVRFDPEAARALLRSEGIDPRTLDPVRIVYNSDQLNKLVAEKVQSQWETHLGVEVELQSREWKVFLRELAHSPPPVYRLGWGADFPDPDNFMNLFTSYSANNHTGWANAEYDRLVDQAAREHIPARRQQLYDRAQRILCEEDVPIVPLFVTSINLVVRPRVRGFEPNPMDLFFLEQVTVE